MGERARFRHDSISSQGDCIRVMIWVQSIEAYESFGQSVKKGGLGDEEKG
jgi:hypothetical protein